MLSALGLELRRRMVERLASGGAMSLSKLVDPLEITLPSAIEQLHILERSGLITSRKQGRVRICALNRAAIKELSRKLASW